MKNFWLDRFKIKVPVIPEIPPFIFPELSDKYVFPSITLICYSNPDSIDIKAAYDNEKLLASVQKN